MRFWMRFIRISGEQRAIWCYLSDKPGDFGSTHAATQVSYFRQTNLDSIRKCLLQSFALPPTIFCSPVHSFFHCCAWRFLICCAYLLSWNSERSLFHMAGTLLSGEKIHVAGSTWLSFHFPTQPPSVLGRVGGQLSSFEPQQHWLNSFQSSKLPIRQSWFPVHSFFHCRAWRFLIYAAHTSLVETLNEACSIWQELFFQVKKIHVAGSTWLIPRAPA